MEQLKSEGFDEKVLKAMHAPIGIDINAETPEEIGVSIVAEMIRTKRD
jgi:xanthine dehydrogenase accessory factor